MQIIVNWGNLTVDEEAKGSNKDVASVAGAWVGRERQNHTSSHFAPVEMRCEG